MSEPILTFNAKSVSCDKLEKTLIGRKEIVDQLFQELTEKITKGETYQSLLVAQRGSGKTHITKVIYCRLKNAPELKDKMVIAYMIEDEYGISNFVHLCIQILNSFVRYKEPGSAHIPAAIDEISELATKNQEAAIKKLLLDFIDKKGLVILLENLETIFDGMGSEAAKLRDLMHEHNQISLVATAQALTDRLTDSKFPFYQFFKTRHLKKLTFDQSFELIKALAALEEAVISKPLLVELNNNPDTRAKIRAIYELTSGNHRLIVHFYGFLKADIKSDLSKVFIKQMNDLKSYYEQFVKRLSIQQQRIVQLLSLSHQPLKGLDIAKTTFLSSNIVSKQLSELTKKGFIDKTKSGKDVFYELQEPLMRICFEINENPDGIAKLFVDFLKVIYEPTQLKKNYLRYKFGARHQEAELVHKYRREAQMYSKALDPKSIYLSPELEEELSACAEEELAYKIDALITEEEIDYGQAIVKLEEKGQYKEALILGKKWVKLEPESFIPYFVLGIIYDHLKEYHKAINHYKKAIELNPKEALIHNNVGNTFSDLKEYQKAIINYEKAIQLKPNKADFYNNLGNTFGDLKEYQKAVVNFEKAIQLKPNNADFYNNLGITFGDLKEYQKAIVNFEKAIQLNPNNTDFYNNLGITFRHLKEYQKAIKHYEKAIKIDPNEAYFYNNLGITFRHLKEYQKAIKYYEKAIEINPNEAYFHDNLGTTYYYLKVYDKAIQHYEKAIEINPNNADFYFNLGTTYDNLKVYDKAIQHYKKAIEINPNNAGFYNNLGNTYDSLKAYEKAIKHYEKALKINPNDPYFYNNLGITYFHLKQYKKAEEQFKKSIQLDNKNANTHGSLIHLDISQNDLKKAESQLKKMLALDQTEELPRLINEDILSPMMVYFPNSSIEKFIGILINQFEKAGRLNLLYDAFPSWIFGILIHLEKYEKEKLQFIKNHLNKIFAEVDKMKISLLLLNVGIRYLAEGDNRALFDLSKEERKVFKDFVLLPREENKNSKN